MAEDLTLEQFFAKSRTIDRHKRLARPATMLMYGLSKDFFADTCLTGL